MSVKLELPAKVDVGLIEIVVGTGLVATVIVNVCALEVPPPGAPFVTVTAAVPVAFTSAARIVAVTWVAEITMVVRGEPFQSTTELDTKFVPFTVRVKPELPAEVEVGEREVVVGTGFVIVKVSEFEVPPPGAPFVTVTEAVPPIVRSASTISAVSVVLEMKCVVRLKPFH